MKILFLCTANENRSRTAEFYFQQRYPQHNIRSAGLSAKECNRSGGRLCSKELLDWADKIFVMEKKHRQRIEQYMADAYNQKITTLNIEDIYKFMEQKLIKVLAIKTGQIQ